MIDLVRCPFSSHAKPSKLVPLEPPTSNPDEIGAPDAMTGVLIGELKGDAIEAEIHVAGRDADVVREANFQLKRSK